MRVSYKVTEFNKDLLVRSMFEDAKSFKYFKIGLDACIEIQTLIDAGCIILDDGDPIPRHYEFKIAFDVHDSVHSMPRLGPDGVMWLGSTMGNIEDTVYVYKKELKDAFGKLSFIKPEDQCKLKFI